MTVSHRQRSSVLVATMVFFTGSALFAAGPASGQAGAPIQVNKFASPLSLPEPGGEFTYTVVIDNPGVTFLVIKSLTDSVYGDLLAARPGSDCFLLAETVLLVGQIRACTFTGTFTGTAGDSLTDTVTVVAQVAFSDVFTTDADDATVTIAAYPLAVGPVLPAVAAPTAFSPATGAAEPSGTFRVTASMGLLALVAIAFAAQVAAAVRARRPH